MWNYAEKDQKELLKTWDIHHCPNDRGQETQALVQFCVMRADGCSVPHLANSW